MNYNKPLDSHQKEMLSRVSPKKEYKPKLFDASTGTSVNKFQKELPRTGIHDNLPVRGSWQGHS